MKKKGTKQLYSGLAPMHSVIEPSGVLPSEQADVTTEQTVTAKRQKKKPVALGYRILSAVLFLLAFGGLFLGVLFAVFPSLEPFSAFRALGDATIDATLMGLYVAIFRDFSLYSAGVGGKLYLAVLFFAAVCILVCIVCSLIAFFAGKKAKICTYVNATSLFLGYVTLFAFNFASVNALYSSNELGFAKEMFDLPTAIIAGIAFVILLVLIFMEKRERAASVGFKTLNVFLYLLTLGVLFAFFYPGTATAGYMTAIDAGLFTVNGAVCGAGVLLVAVLFAFNFFASLLRLYLKKGYAFDTVRYGLQLCALVFFLVAAHDRAIFAQKLPAVICMAVAAFLLFALPFLVTLLTGLHKKDVKDGAFAKEATELTEENLLDGATATDVAAEEEAIALPPVSEKGPLLLAPQPELNAKSIFGTAEPDPKEKYIDEFVAQMIQSEKEDETMLEPTEEFDDALLDENLRDGTLEETEQEKVSQEYVPEEPPAPAPTGEPVYEAPYTPPYYPAEEQPEPPQEDEEIIVFTADNFDPNNPMLFGSTSEPSGVIGANASFLAGMPPVRERVVEKIVEVEKKQPKVELTEFEKQMAEQAKEPVPATEPAYEPLPYADRNQPIIQQTFITNPAQAPAPAPAAAPAPAPAPVAPPAPTLSSAPDFDRIERERRERERERYDSQYAYDPFISTLTPEERNEFGDVFISYRHGVQNFLPAYVIGGDNRKFFRLLFAQLGRYREYISQNLMDKMYSFVSNSKR